MHLQDKFPTPLLQITAGTTSITITWELVVRKAKIQASTQTSQFRIYPVIPTHTEV